MKTRTQFLKSIRSLIGYHQSCGIESYVSTPELQSGLQALERHAAGAPQLTPGGVKSVPEPSPVRVAENPEVFKGASLEELTAEIVQCRICPLHDSRKISTAGRGGAHPHLLIVGDWLGHDTALQGDELFGADQDRMLDNMMKALGLASEDVFITNVIKCSVGQSYRGATEHVSACTSYLTQQIVRLRPAVICTMGSVASQTLLDTDDSLISLRGVFHPYTLTDGSVISVMPTFHPTYLLKNPEMKKPTWGDLQKIGKLLAQRR